MPKRLSLGTDKIYHIFNRGVRKSDLFLSNAHYRRWEELLYWCLHYDYSYSIYLQRVRQIKKEGNNTKLITENLEKTRSYKKPPVEILANVEMSNHFHLVLRQRVDHGISRFMHKLQTSYSKYLNLLHNFKGPVFEGQFKAVLVKSDEQLLQLFRYVHTNPLAGGVVTKAKLSSYPWSSLPSYLEGKKSPFLTKNYLLDYFNNNLGKLWDFTIAEFDNKQTGVIQGLTHDDDFGWYKGINAKKEEKYRELLAKFRRY